jgi:hypothetical protein
MLIVGVVGCGVLGRASPAIAAERAHARRVLVLSLPGVLWRDVAPAELPHLAALLEGSGVADMTVRGANDDPTPADGYVTISTGARAESVPGDGGCEGVGPLATPVCPDLARVVKHNDHLLFDAKVGLLGDTLDAAGVKRAVITTSGSLAALALVDRGGEIQGSIGTAAPVRAFDRVWSDRSVVLVEGAVDRGLRDVDDLVGALLSRVDLARDAVLVVAPGPPPGPLTTTVASLRAPGLRPGLMRSAFTSRSGVVALVDVAPTILDVLGIERPSRMEGRPFEFGRTGGDLDDRVRWLRDTNRRAQLRDRAITQAGGVFVGCEFTLAGLAAIWLARARRRDRGVVALEVASLALLFFLPATYLARLVSSDSGLRTYWWFVAGASIIAAIAVYSNTDRRGVTPVIVALGTIVGVILVDVLTGARLQFNGTFGYSPTIGGRFAGLGNLGYAQLASGAVLLAGLLAYRAGGRAGVWCAGALLATAVIVDGMPFFGADVGGVLSMVPAFGVTLAMLAGWRFRWRLVAWFAAAAVALLGLFAAIDLSRPADRRTHLGRALGGNGSDLSVVLRRKLDANLDVLGATRFAFILPLVYIVVAGYVWRAPGPLGVARARMPALTAALAGFGIVALLGTALNDSGIAITGVMFGVLVPVLVIVAARVGLPAAEPAPRDVETVPA